MNLALSFLLCLAGLFFNLIGARALERRCDQSVRKLRK